MYEYWIFLDFIIPFSFTKISLIHTCSGISLFHLSPLPVHLPPPPSLFLLSLSTLLFLPLSLVSFSLSGLYGGFKIFHLFLRDNSPISLLLFHLFTCWLSHRITLIHATGVNRPGKHCATVETLVLECLIGGVLIKAGDRTVYEEAMEGSGRDHSLNFTAPVPE